MPSFGKLFRSRDKKAAEPAMAAGAPVPTLSPHLVPQRVWGEGLLTPGSRDFVLGMLGQLELKEGMHIAEVDAGLGGASCIVAKEKKVQVSAIGGVPALAAAGAELWQRENLGGRVVSVPYDRSSPSLPKAVFNHAFAKDGLSLDVAFLAAVRDAMLPKGHLVVAQVVGSGDGLDPDDISLLMPQRPGAHGLVPNGKFITTLRDTGFKVINDSVTTAAFVREILGGWAKFAQILQAEPTGRSELSAVLAACERWARIAEMLVNGTLEHRTVSAMRP